MVRQAHHERGKLNIKSVRPELVKPHVPLRFARGPRRREAKLGIKGYELV